MEVIFKILWILAVSGVLSSASSGRGLKEAQEHLSGLKDTLLGHANTIFKNFGILECTGVQGVSQGSFFHQLFGGSGSGESFGNRLCGSTCGGSCKGYTNMAQASSTISYAFGCQCDSRRCGLNGPAAEPARNSNYKVVCQPDATCSCSGVARRKTQQSGFVGYLCNWFNIEKQQNVTFSDIGQTGGNVAVLPVAWCACCPNSMLDQL